MRSQYMRTAFQLGNDASVRISLDTNLCMIYERDAGVMEGDRWYRDPTMAVPEHQITRFPHAVLEIKLEIAEGNSTPPWVKDMLGSGMACEVHKFSKFIHGTYIRDKPHQASQQTSNQAGLVDPNQFIRE